MNNKNYSERKILRLQYFDYSQNGAYFITICTHNKEKTLCDICRGDPCGLPKIKYTPLGKIALECLSLINTKDKIILDKYVIMPNHIHMIIKVDYGFADNRKGCPYSVPQIVGKYKSLVSTKWLKICKQNNMSMGQIWQRSYYDHIIRGEKDYLEIWEYIESNPQKWNFDCYYN